ncbi:PAS domain-containing protein [Streptomyces rishiriensis]|uniref:PAS domain-containing protein n=1 Tax=Streptomyces rishiriensis TaxID=68264 RepID=UPI00379E072D
MSESGSSQGNQSDVSGAAAGTGVPEDFAVVVDAELRIMACSAGARALLGHTSDEVVGRPAADFLAADLPHSAGRRLAASEPWTSDVVLRHRAGDRVHVRLCGTPLPAGEAGLLWLVTGATATYASGPEEADAAMLWDRTLAQLPLSQWWRLVDAGGDSPPLNVRNGMWCTDVEGGSTADGAHVIQWAVGTGTNRVWQIVGV